MLILGDFHLGYDIEIAFKKVKTKIYFKNSTNQLVTYRRCVQTAIVPVFDTLNLCPRDNVFDFLLDRQRQTEQKNKTYYSITLDYRVILLPH